LYRSAPPENGREARERLALFSGGFRLLRSFGIDRLDAPGHAAGGDMSGDVFVRTLQLQHDLAGAITFEPFVGDGRPSDIAAELLQFQTLIGAPQLV